MPKQWQERVSLKALILTLQTSTRCFSKLDKQREENQDVVGEKPVKNDLGVLSLDDPAEQRAWKEHYERLLNVEFP